MARIETAVDESTFELIEDKAKRLKVSKSEMLRRIIRRHFWRIDVGFEKDFNCRGCL